MEIVHKRRGGTCEKAMVGIRGSVLLGKWDVARPVYVEVTICDKKL